MAGDDALLARFEKLIDRLVGAKLAYRAQYTGTVVGQRGDGSLDVRLDSDAAPGMTRLSVKWGVPDASAKVHAGARVVVAFANPDDPKKRVPFVVGWLSATFDELDLGTSSPQPVLRHGDVVQCDGPGGGALGIIRIVKMISPLPPLPPGLTPNDPSKVKAG
jgi:hypothetical protein